MTVVEQAVAVMEEAKQEILKLRQENAELLRALRLAADWDHEMPTDTAEIIRVAIAKAEATK